MNLVFRLIFRLLVAAWRTWRGQIIGLHDELRLRFRCLPSDLDVNLHLTNSRYHSFMDIVRLAMMIRNGSWARLRAAKLLPVLGSSSIRFRKGVAPFQAFEVTARLLTWDDRWLYIVHRVLVGGEVAAAAAVKVAFVGPQGRVATPELLRILGHGGEPPRPAGNLIEQIQSIDKSLFLTP